AGATEEGGSGGSVLLAAGSGQVNLGPNARIDVSKYVYQTGSINVAAAGATGNAYAASFATAPIGYATGTEVVFQATATNTGAGALALNTSGAVNVASVSGDANAYAVGFDAAPADYSTGMLVTFQGPAGNAGATTTVNVNGLGDRAIRRAEGTPIAANDITAGSTVNLVYDGAQFRLLAPRTIKRADGTDLQAGDIKAGA